MAMTRRAWVVTVRLVGLKGRDSRCGEQSVTGDMSESSQGPAGPATYAFTMKLIERPAADTARSRFKAVGSAGLRYTHRRSLEGTAGQRSRIHSPRGVS
jgi:hypothetical protein